MALGMRGGVRYEYHLPKDFSVHALPLGMRLLFSVPEGYTVLVHEADIVSRDTVLARHSDSSVLVCPVFGTVSALLDDTIEIILFEQDEEETPLYDDFAALDADTIVDTVRSYGIFTEREIPLWRVLDKMKGCGELLILNAVENEPGVYAVHGVLHDMPEKVAGGLKIIMKALALGKAVIAITDRMQRSAEKIQKHFRKKNMAQIVTVADKYPVCHPKVLYRTLTGSDREPSLRRAAIVSVMDCIAVYDLFTCGHTPNRKIITVGEKNYAVYIGTPLSEIFSLCGTVPPDGAICHVGGYVSARKAKENESVTMSTTAIRPLYESHIVSDGCIECGKCTDHCPVGLHPMRAVIGGCSKKQMQTAMRACIHCDVCASVCPVGIAPQQVIAQRRANDEN